MRNGKCPEHGDFSLAPRLSAPSACGLISNRCGPLRLPSRFLGCRPVGRPGAGVEWSSGVGGRGGVVGLPLSREASTEIGILPSPVVKKAQEQSQQFFLSYTDTILRRWLCSDGVSSHTSKSSLAFVTSTHLLSLAEGMIRTGDSIAVKHLHATYPATFARLRCLLTCNANPASSTMWID